MFIEHILTTQGPTNTEVGSHQLEHHYCRLREHTACTSPKILSLFCLALPNLFTDLPLLTLNKIPKLLEVRNQIIFTFYFPIVPITGAHT